MKSWSVALILSLICYSATAQQSPMMETLNCSTDYESHTACTWFEQQEAKGLVKMTLFHKDDELNLTKMECTSQKVGSQIRWDCYRNQTYFLIRMRNVFIFKPEQKLEVQKNISLFDDVQLPPPQKLSINVTEDGDFLLSWEAGDGINRSLWLNGALNFEVAYKRIWEAWKESSSFLVSNASHCLLQHNKLVPGNIYIARVRSKPSEDNHLIGHFSDWSPEVTWDTQPDEIEAQPKNLRCRFNGIDRLNCSWEVRKEVTSSVLFSFFYKEGPESNEKECFPVQEKVPEFHLSSNRQYVLQSCEFTVTDPKRQSQYLVTVRTKEEKKEMEMRHQIKPYPPYNLSVTRLVNQEYKLKWQAKNSKVKQMYQISYWKTERPLEAKYVNETNGDQWFIFNTEFLEMSTSYTAQVRAKVHYTYGGGPWSEWSTEIHWPTHRDFTPWGILLIAVISVTLLMVGIYCGHKYFLTKKKEWDANIPSPPITFLLPNFFQKVELPDGLEAGIENSFLELKGINYTNSLQTEMLVTHGKSLEDKLGKTEELSVASLNECKEIQSTSKAGQVLIRAIPENRSVSGSKTQMFDFDGPYLKSPPDFFPSPIWQERGAASSTQEEISVCLKNGGLHHCFVFQQLPMEKEKRVPPSFSPICECDEKKQLLSARQKTSQSSTLKGKGNNGWELENVAVTHSLCQNGVLDYIGLEGISLSKQLNSLLPEHAVSSNESRPICDNIATGTPRTTENFPSTEMLQKKPETVIPAQNQSLTVPSAASQKRFDDYVRDLPALPGSALKKELSFSVEEPKPEKDFFIFNAGSHNPIILSQVGEYCFFPGSRTIKDTCKSQGEIIRCQLSECSKKFEKHPGENQVA